MIGFGQKIGRTGITVPTSTGFAHGAPPRQKPSGAGSSPVEDWGAGAMLMPRGLWVIIRHGRSIIHKRGSAHSLAEWGIPAAVACGSLLCTLFILGVECGIILAWAAGFRRVTLMVLAVLTGSDGDD